MEIKKVWGHEDIIINASYCGKFLYLNKQHRCSIHHHKLKDETFLVRSGQVLMKLDDKEDIMQPGDRVRILPGTKHRFTGLTDCTIIEFSTRDSKEDSYRDTQSEKISDEEFKEIEKKHGLG